MKILVKLVAVSLLLIHTASAETKEAKKVTPEVAPVHNLFDAVVHQKEQQLKKTFSKRMVTRLEKDPGWKVALEKYTGAFKRQFGDFTMENLKFKFEADASDKSKGKIWILLKGKTKGKLNVILEDKSWKMDEL